MKGDLAMKTLNALNKSENRNINGGYGTGLDCVCGYSTCVFMHMYLHKLLYCPYKNGKYRKR